MPELVLGPVLRHVGECDATIWVETDQACTVEVRTATTRGRGRTFTVGGHAYALVVVGDLPTGTCQPYEVLLDGRHVWPSPRSPYPPSLIRTLRPGQPIRLLFGSCRSPASVVVHDRTGSGDDALAAYARGLVASPPDDWPDALVMLGDQVYADETSPAIRRVIRRRRDVRSAPREQVADFEEYTSLYHEAWGDPDVRWLLSTIPSSMIFDDHDVIDDWNTSAAWRRDVFATRWWDDRIVGALTSYWIYQHLGNLTPEALEADETYRAVRAVVDGEDLLRRFARRADREADGGSPVMWSFRRDLGRVRLVVIDSRAGRVLTEGARSMVGEDEFAWIERQVDGDYDHLVIGTSVPWLLPRALHDLESADEALAAGARGRVMARVAERLRRWVDLEHWAAFRTSFDRLARLVGDVGRDGARLAPASICVISGDVHHTYASEARFPASTSRVFQLTCSPFHNTIPLPMRFVFRLAWGRWAHGLSRRLAAFARVPDVPFEWRTAAGPYFGNHVGLLRFEGRAAELSLARPERVGPVTVAVPVATAGRRLAPARIEPPRVPLGMAT